METNRVFIMFDVNKKRETIHPIMIKRQEYNQHTNLWEGVQSYAWVEPYRADVEDEDGAIGHSEIKIVEVPLLFDDGAAAMEFVNKFNIAMTGARNWLEEQKKTSQKEDK